jgi:hypothetical protein
MHEKKQRNGGRLRAVLLATLVAGLALSATIAAVAKADTLGRIGFEASEGYAPGNINGQQGWMKTGPFDVEVESVASYPAAAGYGFDAQALRLSNAVTSGSFGDQTFSPGLLEPAGEAPARPHFEASFRIGTALATHQPGLTMSVSPDDGNGSRMSYLRFEDRADGVHVFFVDVTNPGPFPTVSSFDETEIATLSRTRSHSVEFLINFFNGPGNDVVKVYIDGRNRIKGTTWENYYRYDPEQVGNGNQVPAVDKLLFRLAGAAAPANAGNGFLVDDVRLESSGHH